ncbi:nucleolar protein dao-5 isoform X2 [Solea solea]|uniref:nucleolar protein dao-5 isoform X2 n=1 Tax=Solea solea TaxID=90069 RepID=UPI00272A2EA0|nr:nucleolar protein dao-5 isoform X2 [Solea solea]
MRGDTATENDVEEEGTSVTEAASEERRPSIVALQNMLKRVSQSPFHSQHKDGEPLRDVSAATDNSQLHLEQTGVNADSSRVNPFYAYYLESGSKGHTMEDEGMKTYSEPEKDFTSNLMQSTLAQKASANGHLHSPDVFNAITPQTQDPFKSLWSKNSGEGGDLLKNSKTVDLQSKAQAKEENLLDRSPNKEDNLRQPTTGNQIFTSLTNEDDLFPAFTKNKQESSSESNWRSQRSKELYDVFSSSSTNTSDCFPSPLAKDLFKDISSLEDPFGATPSKQYNAFPDMSNGTPDIFQPLYSKTNSNDVFETSSSSTASKASFPRSSFNSSSIFPDSLEDPFATPLSDQSDTFHISNGTPDIFQPISSKTNGKDLFETNPSNAASKAVFRRPSLNVPSGVKSEKLPPNLFRAASSVSPPAVPPKPSNNSHPQGTKHAILQPTPFSQAMKAPVSPDQSPELNHTFRRPPRPLPRTRPPRAQKPPRPEKPQRPENPPTPPPKPIQHEPVTPKMSPKLAFKPLPMPVFPRKPKKTDVEPADYVVFEDILLIGQERCVEDWPEDSPQLNPEFKPSGKLRLRRESMKMRSDSDGGSGEDLHGYRTQSKKKDKKFKMSLLSRRGSKDKFPDDMQKGGTLPNPRKSSKDYFSEVHIAEEDEDRLDYRKKPLKTKVNQLLRRASTVSSVPEGKKMNGRLPQESKGKVLDDSAGEDDYGGEANHGERRKSGMKSKFVPQRGFTISGQKNDDEPKGAHGYTPRNGSKVKSLDDDDVGSYAKKSQDYAFEDIEEMKTHSLQSYNKAAFMEDKHVQHPDYFSPGLNGDEDSCGKDDCRPKKPSKMTFPVSSRKSSKDMPDAFSPQKKGSFSAEELDDEMKTFKHKGFNSRKSKANHVPGTHRMRDEPVGMSHYTPQQAAFTEDQITGNDFTSREDLNDYVDDEIRKPKKSSKLKGLKVFRTKSKSTNLSEATTSDYLSEAAQAEWMAAQKDSAVGDFEDDEEEGDTDSLMEWWHTVEQWDELPSDDEGHVMEDEAKSFAILSDKVQRGLRVFHQVFTERAEFLWLAIITLHTIADDISEYHEKAKKVVISGGTTSAAGGATAIVGLALAPFTFGTSLVITAIGVGIATAGGITSASAAISDNLHNAQDRKKIENVLQEYEVHLQDIGKILHFVDKAVYRLRGHPFLRSGTQHYSSEWETRHAVQVVAAVDRPVMRAVELIDDALAMLQGLFKDMDSYFVKESRELKKGCRREVVSQIKMAANKLNDSLVELNVIREELQDATGSA